MKFLMYATFGLFFGGLLFVFAGFVAGMRSKRVETILCTTGLIFMSISVIICAIVKYGILGE